MSSLVLRVFGNSVRHVDRRRFCSRMNSLLCRLLCRRFLLIEMPWIKELGTRISNTKIVAEFI